MQGKPPLVRYAPLAIWLIGVAIPIAIHFGTTYSHGESGLIQLAALFQLGTLIVAVAAAVAFLVAAIIWVISPLSRRVAAIGGILNCVTFALAAPSAVSFIQNYGQPIGCRQVGPDMQIGPDADIQSGEQVSIQFHAPQLRQLHQQVNSPSFRAELARRLCLDTPIPVTVSVRLLQESDCRARMVGSSVSPPQNAKCFSETYRYLFQRAVRNLDPAPSQSAIELLTWPEPNCPCTDLTHE